LPAYNEVDRWLKEADTTAASAETNTLARLDLAESDILVLLHSDTPEGLFCAERLKAFYEGRVRETILARIGKLGYGPPSLPRGSRPSWMQ
jgi:putative CRISPR-associated protein (TIGR02619 family)